MAQEPSADDNSGQRGPADHIVREQIVTAAKEHFAHFGYSKTTVSDLAKAIGFSKAYIYKFFDSKQAIGQEICANCLRPIPDAVRGQISEARDAPDRMKRFLWAATGASVSLFRNERRLFDIAETSSAERWPAYLAYLGELHAILRKILVDGRAAQEFERKTPLDEVTRAIMQAIQPFIHPLMLRENLALVPEGPGEMIGLILRSLAP